MFVFYSRSYYSLHECCAWETYLIKLWSIWNYWTIYSDGSITNDISQKVSMYPLMDDDSILIHSTDSKSGMFAIYMILGMKIILSGVLYFTCTCISQMTRQHSTQSVRNMPPPSPRHLLPHVLQIMPRNANYDQFQPKGHHNEENPQSMTKMPGNPKFYLFH